MCTQDRQGLCHCSIPSPPPPPAPAPPCLAPPAPPSPPPKTASSPPLQLPPSTVNPPPAQQLPPAQSSPPLMQPPPGGRRALLQVLIMLPDYKVTVEQWPEAIRRRSHCLQLTPCRHAIYTTGVSVNRQHMLSNIYHDLLLFLRPAIRTELVSEANPNHMQSIHPPVRCSCQQKGHTVSDTAPHPEVRFQVR